MKKLFLPVLAVLALASCSKSELTQSPNDGQVEIKLTQQVLSIDTRVPYENFPSNSNPLASFVVVSKTSGNYTDLYCSGPMTFKGGLASFDDPQYYPTDNSVIYLSALCPADDWTDVGTTAKHSFDGKTDVMATAEVSSQKSTAVDAPEITFEHLLTKLRLKFQANNEAALNAWGKVIGVKVLKADGHEVNSAVTVTLASGTAEPGTAFADPAAGGIPFYYMDNDTSPASYTDDPVSETNSITPTTTTPKTTAYTMVEPIMADADNAHYQLEITTKKDSEEAVVNIVDVKLTESGYMATPITGSTQGLGYDITVLFNAKDIQLQPNVTYWGDQAGVGNVEL